jgi:hypothetical protein
MKLNTMPLLLATALAIATIAASPANAERTTTGFGSFHVQSGTPIFESSYQCLTEDNGAVVNNCNSPVNLFFDLPIDTAGAKAVSIQDYWLGPVEFLPFNCVSYSYTGRHSSSRIGTQVTFGTTLTTLTTQDYVAPGDTIAVICWAVPPGEGVASLTWNQ